VLIAKAPGQPLDGFANVARWRQAVKERPAVQRGVDLGKEFRRKAPPARTNERFFSGRRPEPYRFRCRPGTIDDAVRPTWARNPAKE
jgi:hypothetical protein